MRVTAVSTLCVVQLVHPAACMLMQPTTGYFHHRSQDVFLAAQMLAKAKHQGMDYLLLKSDGSDSWRASSALESIRQGGVGVIPTDTAYSFVTSVSSKKGVERILRLKGADHTRKPLSLLCRDMADIDKFALGIDRPLFKLLRSHLPGPYTFVLRASPALPKVVYHDGQRQWKRSEIGVRIPDDPVCAALLDELDEPLLCSTVPLEEESGEQLVCDVRAEIGDTWCTHVNFVIDAGPRPVDGSSVYDLREGRPILVREGIGPLLGE